MDAVADVAGMARAEIAVSISSLLISLSGIECSVLV